MNEKSKLDQMLAGIRDTAPRLWFAVYTGCKEAGFSETQAFDLVKTWVGAQVSSGVLSSSNTPPDQENDK